MSEIHLSENEILSIRRQKLQNLRKAGNPFPNEFKQKDFIGDILGMYTEKEATYFEEPKIKVAIAGRIMLFRQMGKASFVHIQDMSGRIQLYVKQDEMGEAIYEAFKTWDLGDIIAVNGYLFKTRTGELSVHAETIQLLTKSLRPLPDKFHGLTDKETRYRQRYVDLIMNQEVRRTFEIRSKVISGIRQFLNERRYFEVETPMMHPIAGGAAARPFVTHHNTLDMDLYLRIAPELYLKRLVVGGIERVYEINRNFRNEGISSQHNPEFTMIEFYQAYATYKDMIDLTENLIRHLAKSILGTLELSYQGRHYDLSKPFTKMTVKEAILAYNPDIKAEELENLESAKAIAKRLNVSLRDNDGLGKVWIEIFEATAEHQLFDPTFITEYPTEVSPLARSNNENPFVTDRFEFFISGFEMANGFSELNDAEDQAERFRLQSLEKAAGDYEAMSYDEDYIRALEFGLPPTAGEGIGIDRLVMFLTDSASIRDVIFFPHMRKEDVK